MAQVIVYKNLRRGDWSVAELKGARGRGKVIDHVRAIVLTDVTFVVSEASRQSVIRNRERSVHAYCVGTRAPDCTTLPTADFKRVTYNPYRSGDFTTESGEAVTKAAVVAFAPNGKAYCA